VAGRSLNPGLERRTGHDDIELSRLPGEIERSNVSQQPGAGMEFGVSNRKIRIKRQLALRIDVAGDQEIQSDRRIRVGAWLGLLSFDICGPDHQRDYPKRATKRDQ